MAQDVLKLNPIRGDASVARPADVGRKASAAPMVREQDREKESTRSADFDPARLAEAVERANDIAAASPSSNRKVRFDVDGETSWVVVRVIDGETDRVVRQMPPEEFLNMSKRLDQVNALMFDDVG